MIGLALPSPRGLVRRFSPAITATASHALKHVRSSGVLLRPGVPTPHPLGRLGSLEVRLAISASEIRRAQALRYQVFYKEMSAVPDLRARRTRRDQDGFDRVCDHLLVIDHADRGSRFGRAPKIVGTYRLLPQDVADWHSGFYSAGEFDVGALTQRMPALNFLELGRSCVLPAYRNKRTLELLWHGIWTYVLMNGFDVMIGCASLAGTDSSRLAIPLSFLHHHARAPKKWQVRAHARIRVDMDLMPASAVDAKTALKALPPLIKGYLRLGAMVGDGAVIDRQFGTTDVLIVLPVAAINSRYIDFYGADASRRAFRELSTDQPRAAA